MESKAVELVERELGYAIVKAFFHVYNLLGFGFLEQIYSRALEVVLTRMGHRVQREVPLAVMFEGQQIGFHRLDMLVDERVAIEIKATEALPDACHQQLRNYLAALRFNGQPIRLGILLHFGPRAKYYRHLAPSQ
jgi:GxxExxY protein